MQLQIIVKEKNKPSRKALQAFNQSVFEVVKRHQQNGEQIEEGVTSNE
ncbi:MAG: hypothetical protein ABFC84_04140 [Veillonellales bacterium]